MPDTRNTALALEFASAAQHAATVAALRQHGATPAAGLLRLLGLADARPPAAPGRLTGRPLDPGDNANLCPAVVVTPNQRASIEAAVAAFRERNDMPHASEGRALELICVEYMQ